MGRRMREKKVRVVNGKLVELAIGETRKPKKRTRARVYDERVHSALRQIRQENVVKIRSDLPFPLHGVDSDNGGEFINMVPLNYCNDSGIEFTRGRSCRKNDNCFVEQKNDLAVRRTVGYYRFDSDEVKQELRRRARQLHIVKQKRLVDQAIAKLLRIHQEKNRRALPFSGSSTTT